jgi:hypothetical protein
VWPENLCFETGTAPGVPLVSGQYKLILEVEWDPLRRVWKGRALGSCDE